MPGYTEGSELTFAGKTLPILDSDEVFTPTGKGEVLAKFGEDAGILSVPYGKGKVVVLGFNPGLKRYAALPAICEGLLRQLGVSAKFIVSEADLLLREWNHGDDCYLILTSDAKDWQLREVNIKVRGKVEIEDYLFGEKIKTQYRNGYTEFNTLSFNGGRVFRIPGQRLASVRRQPVLFAESRKHPLEYSLGEASGVSDNYESINLPFEGQLYDSAPLKFGDYVFSLTTLSSGNNADVGDMYISVSLGKEVQRKHLTAEQDYYFRFRDKIFKLRSSRNFYMYPFYCILRIEQVDSIPESSAPELKKKINQIELSNSLISFNLDADRGGTLSSIKLADDRAEQVYSGEQCYAALTTFLPGPFLEQKFNVNLLERSAELLKVELKLPAPAQGKDLRQLIELEKDCAGFGLSLLSRNTHNMEQSYGLRWHPGLCIGSSADTADCFFVPSAGEVKKIPFKASASGHSLPPSDNWSAIVDRDQKLAYICSFKREQVEKVYVWESSNFYTFELFNAKKALPPGGETGLDMRFYFLRGLSGVDIHERGLAAYLHLPDLINQSESFAAELQMASAYGNIKQVKLNCELWQDERLLLRLGTQDVALAYDLPLAWQLNANLQELPDGEYQFRININVPGRDEIILKKNCKFAGTRLNQLLNSYQALSQRLLANDALQGDELFAVKVLLQNFRRSIAEGNPEKAAALQRELQKRP